MKKPEADVPSVWVLLCLTLSVLSLLVVVSCKKSANDPVSPATPTLQMKGRIVFQVQSNGATNGISLLDFAAQPVQAILVVPGGMEPRPSPDGKSLVYWKDSGPLFVSNLDGTNATPILSLSESYFNWPDWSPDGHFIVFQNQWRQRPRDELVLVERTGGTLRTVVDTLTVSRSIMPRWSPDGTLIAFFGQDSLFKPTWLSTVAPDGSKYSRRIQGNDWWLPEWSPDGRKIAFAAPRTGDPVFRSLVLDLISGSTWEIGGGSQPVRQARWLPDGRLLSWDESTVYVAAKDPPYINQVLAGGFSFPPVPLGSPDSTQVGIFGHREGGGLDFFVVGVQSGVLQKIATVSSASDAKIPESQPAQWLR